ALRPPAHDDGPHPPGRGLPAAEWPCGHTRGAERGEGDRPRRAGPLLAAEPLLRAGPRAEVDVRRPVAVVGVGQTRHASRRSDVSIPGLVREAVDRALLDAGLDYADIDAVVMGKAPDQLEGVMQPEQFLAGALGAHLKPLIRVHTAGSVGASTALAAVTHVASGLFDRVLTVAWEKQSEGNAMWALSPNLPFTPPLVAGAGGFFAPYCRAYMARTGCPPHIGPMVAANARANGGRNEYASLREPRPGQDGPQAPGQWAASHCLRTVPSSDGHCARRAALWAPPGGAPRQDPRGA